MGRKSFFNLFKRELVLCEHKDVKIITVDVVTLMPSTGVCKICKKHVKSRLIWEKE